MLSLITSGTRSSLIRCASPSAIAVLPTPESPTKTTLFFLRRAIVCTSFSSSSSRPITGSITPSAACSLRLSQYLRSVRSSLRGFILTSAVSFTAVSLRYDTTLSRLIPSSRCTPAVFSSLKMLINKSRGSNCCLPLNNACVNARLNTRPSITVFLGSVY